MHEIDEYTVNKRIVNMLCDMGYVIKDGETGGIKGAKNSSLIKKTDKHLLMINF